MTSFAFRWRIIGRTDWGEYLSLTRYHKAGVASLHFLSLRKLEISRRRRRRYSGVSVEQMSLDCCQGHSKENVSDIGN